MECDEVGEVKAKMHMMFGQKNEVGIKQKEIGCVVMYSFRLRGLWSVERTPCSLRRSGRDTSRWDKFFWDCPRDSSHINVSGTHGRRRLRRHVLRGRVHRHLDPPRAGRARRRRVDQGVKVNNNNNNNGYGLHRNATVKTLIGVSIALY